MTMEEKLSMYSEKKKFIENLNDMFQVEPRCPSVEGVTYEVYTKDYGDDRIDTREWIIVHFIGGGKSIRIVSGNSNLLNSNIYLIPADRVDDCFCIQKEANC